MKSRHWILSGFVLAAVSLQVQAATLTWDADMATGNAQDGSGTWDTVSTNWWGGATNVAWNNVTPDSAIFGNGGTGGVVSLAEPIWAGGLTFNILTNVPSYTNNYTITSNTLTLASGAVLALNSFSNSTATSIANATLSSSLNGTNITKIGAGTLTLSGTNTLTGQMLINSGTVTFANSGVIGSMTSVVLSLSVGGGGLGTTLAFAGNITNGAGAVLEMNSSEGTPVGSRRTAINSVSGINEWAGQILLKGNGLDQPEANGGTLTLSGDITNQNFTGTLFVRGSSNGRIIGNVDAGAAALLNKTDGGTWTVGAPGKTYRWGNTSVSVGTLKMGASNVLPATTVLTIGQGDGNSPIFDLNGFDQTVAGLGLNTSGGNKQISNLGSVPATLTVSNTAAYTYGGVFANGANPLNLVKSGTNMLTLTGTNGTFTGATTINQGTLVIGAAGTLAVGTYSGAITNYSYFMYSSSATQTLSGAISGTGPIEVNGSGTLRLSGQSSYSGTTLVNAGKLQNAGGADRLPTNGTIAVNGDGNPIATWDLNGQSQAVAALNGTNIVGSRVTLGSGTLKFAGSGAATGEFFGAISGSGSVAMNGGAQILSSSNSYGGGTTINNGNLIIRHNASLGTGALTYNGGTLTLDASGLWGGAISSATFDVTSANPKWTVDRKTTFANTSDLFAFPTNTTWIYSGYLNVTSSTPVTWTFVEYFDDWTRLVIDGSVVLYDLLWSNATMATVTLAPGLHSFEARFGQSTGGVGPVGGWPYAFGFDKLGRGQLVSTNYSEMVEPGDGSLFVRDDLYVTNELTLNAGIAIAVPVGKASLGGTILGSGGLTKTGAGTLDISLLAAYDGPTLVTGGTLLVDGYHAGAGAITVATNATLWGTGTVVSAATTINAGGRIGAPITATGGSLTLGALVLDSGSKVSAMLNGSTPTIHVAGDLGSSAGVTLDLWPLSIVATGTYVLIDYDANFTGAIGDFGIAAFPNGSQGYLTNDLGSTSINLVITNAGAGIKWLGNVNASWDLAGTANWQSILTAGPTVFATRDSVLFDDTASGNYTVNLTQVVSPGSITVSNDTKDYVIGGLAIAGSAGLVKDGAARLTMSSANTFTGATVVKAGTLSIAADSSIGTPPAVATAGQLTLGGGSKLELASAMTLNANRGVSLGQGAGIVSVPTGIAATVAGIIADASGATGSLVKAGSGTLTLTAASTYGGGTTISNGTLQISGGANRLNASSTVTVVSGANLNLGGQNQQLTGLLGQGVVTSSFGTLTIQLAAGRSNQVDATLAGTMALTKGGDTNNGLGALYLTGANTFTGLVYVSAGPLIIKSSSALGIGPKTVDIANGTAGRPTLSLDGSAGNLVLASNITIRTSNNAGTMTNLVGDNVINGNFTLSGGGGDTIIKIAGGSLTLNGNLTFDQPNRNLYLGGVNTGWVNGAIGTITNNVGLQKIDSGKWVLGADCSYNAGTVISAGTLQVGKGGTSGSISTNACSNNGTLVFNRSGIFTNVPLISGTGTLVNAGTGTLVLEKNETYTGPTLVNSGALLLRGTLATPVIAVGPSAGLIVQSTITNPVTISTNGSLTVDGTLNAGLAGSTGVSVLVNGTINSAYNNFAGGSISGTGTINGSILSDGVIAPGSPVGALTFQQNYTQTTNASLNIEIGGASSYDALVVGGSATLAGALNVTLVNGYTGIVDDIFIVFASASASGAFTSTNLPALGAGLSWSVQDLGSIFVLSITNSGTLPPTGYDLAAQQISDPAKRGYQADADGDGYANLLEYVTGSSLTNADADAQMSGARTNAALALKFRRDTNTVDAVLIVEGSFSAADAADWTGFATNIAGSWGGATNVVENIATNPIASVTVYDTVPAATNRYLRLRVTRP